MPPQRKAPWHRGTFHVRSQQVRAAAYADPSTRCWRCHRTLAEVRAVKPRAKWTAGHVIDSQIDGELRAECSVCNMGHGARLVNARRKADSYRNQPHRTDLTW